MTSAFYLDKPADATAYLHALDRICVQATPARDTPVILEKIRKET